MVRAEVGFCLDGEGAFGELTCNGLVGPGDR